MADTFTRVNAAQGAGSGALRLDQQPLDLVAQVPDLRRDGAALVSDDGARDDGAADAARPAHCAAKRGGWGGKFRSERAARFGPSGATVRKRPCRAYRKFWRAQTRRARSCLRRGGGGGCAARRGTDATGSHRAKSDIPPEGRIGCGRVQRHNASWYLQQDLKRLCVAGHDNELGLAAVPVAMREAQGRRLASWPRRQENGRAARGGRGQGHVQRLCGFVRALLDLGHAAGGRTAGRSARRAQKRGAAHGLDESGRGVRRARTCLKFAPCRRGHQRERGKHRGRTRPQVSA
jgi:hypothetical protein